MTASSVIGDLYVLTMDTTLGDARAAISRAGHEEDNTISAGPDFLNMEPKVEISRRIPRHGRVYAYQCSVEMARRVAIRHH